MPADSVISPTAGTITFGAFSLGASPAGPSGDGVLAVLTMRALTEGEGGVSFEQAQISNRAGSPQTIAALMDGRVRARPGWKVCLPLVLRSK